MKHPTHRLAIFGFVALYALVACDIELETAQSGSSPTGSGVPIDAPRLRIRVSGNLEGYLKPCGCASGQMGGLARRAFRNNLDGRNIDLFLEGGNLIKKAGELEFAKLITTLTVLSEGDHAYKGLGLAARDLTLPKDELELVSAFPFISSDLRLADGKPWKVDGELAVPPFREEKLAPVTVRIASLTMSLPAGDAGKPFKLLPPAEAWAAAMDGAAPTTYRVLMVHADGDTVKKLRFAPKPDLIVAVNHDYVEPPPSADSADGVPLVYVGTHGRLLLDVTVVRGPEGSQLTNYESVALKGSRTAPEAMRDKNALAIIQGHRETVKEDGMLERLARRKKTPSGASYVGGKVCAECHEDDADTCQKHAHSRAWQTLVEAEKRERWPVTSYPECVSCHVVGYGYKSGFVSPTKTPELLNVTCENCHGPGSVHVNSDGDESMPMSKPEVQGCIECHNFEHSPKFDYTSFWKKIEHGN